MSREIITDAHKDMWVNILATGGKGQLRGTVVRVVGAEVTVKNPFGTLEKHPIQAVRLWKARNAMLGLKPAEAQPDITPKSEETSQRKKAIPVHPPTEAKEVEEKLTALDAKEAAEEVPLDKLLPALGQAKADIKEAETMIREAQDLKNDALLRFNALRDRVKEMMDLGVA
jgi:hypothetical protein